MIAKLICFAGLGVLLITPAWAVDEIEKCENKLKCRGSVTVSHGTIKQLNGSQPPSNSGRPSTAASHGGRR